ncbi:FtsW/RodA/SpoVE family cell cycle protein [Bacillus manliponensis]|uniref:FtsW/RodA/SpoVE family cell cycle protein n=1 Tax=Bacillus manliponensis TaxID=574376 RepID=UPI003516E513
MFQARLSYVLSLFVMLPPLSIGVIAMNVNNVPKMIWMQNIIIFLIGVIISYFVIWKRKFLGMRQVTYVPIACTIFLLALTFIDPGIDDVHRWISLGPIKLYIASIVLPLLILLLGRFLSQNNWGKTFLITCIVTVILFLQPDASQLTAFVIPMALLLWRKADAKVSRALSVCMLFVFIALSWIYLDHLAPVLYVEDIMDLVRKLGTGWSIIGIMSLLLLPAPFIFSPPSQEKLVSFCIGLYFLILLISAYIGHFPVPLMGYGVSPIIGYFIAITWLAQKKAYCT